MKRIPLICLLLMLTGNLCLFSDELYGYVESVALSDTMTQTITLDSVDGGVVHTYSGLIDNVRIYGRALTAAEISLCYAVEKYEHE